MQIDIQVDYSFKQQILIKSVAGIGAKYEHNCWQTSGFEIGDTWLRLFTPSWAVWLGCSALLYRDYLLFWIYRVRVMDGSRQPWLVPARIVHHCQHAAAKKAAKSISGVNIIQLWQQILEERLSPIALHKIQLRSTSIFSIHRVLEINKSRLFFHFSTCRFRNSHSRICLRYQRVCLEWNSQWQIRSTVHLRETRRKAIRRFLSTSLKRH